MGEREQTEGKTRRGDNTEAEGLPAAGLGRARPRRGRRGTARSPWAAGPRALSGCSPAPPGGPSSPSDLPQPHTHPEDEVEDKNQELHTFHPALHRHGPSCGSRRLGIGTGTGPAPAPAPAPPARTPASRCRSRCARRPAPPLPRPGASPAPLLHRPLRALRDHVMGPGRVNRRPQARPEPAPGPAPPPPPRPPPPGAARTRGARETL